MNKLNKILSIIIILITAIGFYHMSTFLKLDRESCKSLYHIAHNGIILSLGWYILSTIKGNRKYLIHRKIIRVISIYFIYKVLLNVLFLISFIRGWLLQINTHIWGLMLTCLILILLTIIKFMRYDRME